MRQSRDLGKHALIVLTILLLSSVAVALIRNFLHCNILLFESIVLCSLMVFVVVLVVLAKSRLKVTPATSLQTLYYVSLIGLLCTLIILPNTLLNIDRSRSLYVLNWVNLGQLNSVNGELVVDVASPESSDLPGVQLRLGEQIKRGLVIDSGGEYELSKSGRFVLRIAEFLSSVFNLSNWQINKS